jgi:hypothetical protein
VNDDKEYVLLDELHRERDTREKILVNILPLLCPPHVLSKVSKAVPLHAMEAHGGRGGIAPTHT